MLSRQEAFCGFLFHKLQSHSKAGMTETYLTPDFLYIQTTIWPESYFCSYEVFIPGVNWCCCVWALWVHHTAGDRMRKHVRRFWHRSTQLKCRRYCQCGGRKNRFLSYSWKWERFKFVCFFNLDIFIWNVYISTAKLNLLWLLLCSLLQVKEWISPTFQHPK